MRGSLLGDRVLGENNKNLGKIVAVLAKCLGKGSGGKDSLVDADTWQKIVTLLQQMNSSLPPTVSCSLFLMVACLAAHIVSYDALMMWCHDVIHLSGPILPGLQVMQEFYSQLKPKERTRLEAALSGQAAS